MNKLFLLLFPAFLFGNFAFNEDVETEVEILRKFDVDSSFLNDKYFQQKLQEYKTEARKVYFFKALSKAIISLPTIKKIISESKIPNEFLYLAMAESQLNSRVYSHKHAAGMWQFIPETARLYDLRIDRYIDERLDIVKSTHVAIQFLHDMHKQFKKWYLAAIAYNCGEGTLRRAIQKAGTDDLQVLIDPNNHYLPRESRNYIRKILSFAILEQSQDVFNSDFSYLLNIGRTSSLVTVQIGGGEKLSRVATLLGMEAEELIGLNTHILNRITPPEEDVEYNIHIPHHKLPLFRKMYHPIIENGLLYIVRSGDSLYKIGKRFGISFKEIKNRNALKNSNLYIGQKLIIPIVYNSKVEDNGGLSHLQIKDKYKVKRGDTLYSIAREFRIDVESLMRKNNLDEPTIHIGEKLIVE
jgi:membrane-bound lytic murein transglycosylase D